MNKKVVCRAAPSPTSPYGLHVGNIRTILYNYLFAKQNGGTFYLRIEDTDQDRFCPGAEDLIRKSLEWIGMEPDFAPWTEHPFGSMRQSERDYSTYIKYLLDTGNAYYAFDSKEELDVVRAADKNFSYNSVTRMNLKNSLTLSPTEVQTLLDNKTLYVVRFKVIPNVDITFTDIIRGEVTINSNQMDDKVLLKSNGIGSYHLCNVCDDHDMGTTHVIRGEEWLSSVPIHIMLYKAFGWDIPEFAHLPLVLNPPPMKGKLSKRNASLLGIPIFPFGGDGVDDKGVEFTLKGFVDEGYEPEALINFLCLLGWTPHDIDARGEIMSMDDAIAIFDLHSVHKSGAKYDIDKLNYFNGWYLQNKISNDELLGCVQFGDSHFSHEDKLNIIEMAKKRSHFRKDLQSVVDIFIKHPELTEKQLATITDLYKQTLLSFVSAVETTTDWDADYIKQSIYNACEVNGMKMGKIMPIFRTVLASGVTGPDMVSFMTMLPKTEILNRISNTVGINNMV
jgi:glutamyl-tRNA synthetase